jgi:tetratricopeptide (TPR) repeat protein
MRLHQIDPAHPELRELAAAVGATEEVALPDEGVEEEEEVVLAPGDVTDEPDLYDDSLALAAARDEGEEVVEEEHAAATPRAALEPPPPAPAPKAPSDSDRASPPPDRKAQHVDLSDEMEEADFFVQQGLFADARQALENLLAFYPEHPAVRAKLADVERRAASAATVEPVAAAPASAPSGDVPAADTSFDIARELADELGGAAGGAPADEEFQYSVEDVFNQFKKGIEQTVRAEDTATHYDLGIAYKEMGLIDDAVNEFETALRGSDRKRDVDCLSMIGLCRMAKEEPRAAIEVFRRALSSDHLTKDAAKAIHYDLATAYEAAGDKEAALYYFQRVAKVDQAFRDAAARASALGGGPGRPPAHERAARSTPNGGSATRPPPARPATPAAPAGATKKNIGYL